MRARTVGHSERCLSLFTLSSPAWVEVFVHRLEPLLIDVGVDLGSGDVGMTQEFLNDAEVGPVFQEVGREGMPQEVRVDVLLNTGLLRAFFDDLSHAIR